MDRPYVRVIQDHELISELPLRGSLRIGRRDDNDLVLVDESVSGYHGLIDHDENGWRYTDLGSVNGSIVAAGPTLRARQSVELSEDTQVLIGATVLDVRIETNDATATTGSGVSRPAAAPAAPVPPIAPTAPAPAARLVIVVGGTRHTVALTGPRALIGRAEECDVLIEDTSVSLRHAELRWERGEWLLRDLNSTNGTRVGVRRLTRPQPVLNNTQILVGEANMLFLHDGPEGDVPDADRVLAALRRERMLTRSQAQQAEQEFATGRRQLGEILVAAGWVSPGQWIEALTEAAAPTRTPTETPRRRWPWLLVILAALAVGAWLLFG